MPAPEIRDARPADAAFLVDCNAAMATETEGKRLPRDVLARGIAGVFEQPGRGFYLIAWLAGEPVGCLLVTTEWSDWRNGDWWWLQSVYVVPGARRRGVFRALHAEVERRARAAGGVVGLRLYVEADNHAAQATYRAFGMGEAPYRLMENVFAEGAPP